MRQPLRRGFYQYTPLSNPPLPSQSFSPQTPAVINHFFLNWSLDEYLWKGKKRYSIHTIKDSVWMVFVWRQRGIHTDGDAVRNVCVCVCVCARTLMCSWIGLGEAKGFYESIGWDLVLGPTLWIFFSFCCIHYSNKKKLNACSEVCVSHTNNLESSQIKKKWLQ